MCRTRRLFLIALFLIAALVAETTDVRAQTGYGVTANGALFRFDVNSPGTITTIGNMGIVTDAIDFRPGTGTLYGIDVGPTTSQLYTINPTTAAVTPVGTGFPTVVTGTGAYNLADQTIGFDFNPRTLQADGSIRIRLVASRGANLRLNSNTGLVAAVDTPLAYVTPIAPGVDSVAYTNSGASTIGGLTTLFGVDANTDNLVRQGGVDGTPSPNGGLLTSIGALGATVNSIPNVGFDILSTGTDDSNADELAFAVFARPDAPIGVPGKFLLYDVNLATGQTLNGRLVGAGVDFTGGFAVIPEPSSLILTACALVGVMFCRIRVRSRARGRC
ncbi:MAG: DUF4394 domain-containing protein [Pirellulales bacterium]